MKIAQHLLISDKNTFEQLTPEDKKKLEHGENKDKLNVYLDRGIW